MEFFQSANIPKQTSEVVNLFHVLKAFCS